MRAGLIVLALLLSACAGPVPRSDGPPTGRTAELPAGVPKIPGPEPRSRYGNPPHYEEFGERYYVLPSSDGYRERGVASWYGRKFHGKRTSSGETYDMHRFTAAHKTLPLPTWVEVTNLRNRRSIVVRVNDRGPFVANRIIDLSYAAAEELDIVRDGTGLVEVRALSFGSKDAGDTMTAAVMAPPPAAETPVPAAPAEDASPAGGADEPPLLYVQVGAFSQRDNAERQHARLLAADIANAFIYEDASEDARLYRVRVGPIATVEEYDAMVLRLNGLGIDNVHMIIE